MAIEQEPVLATPNNTDTYTVSFSYDLQDINDFIRLRNQISGRTHSSALDFGIYKDGEETHYIIGDSVSHQHLNTAVMQHNAKQGISVEKLMNGHIYVDENDKIYDITFHSDLGQKTKEHVLNLLKHINSSLLCKNGVSIYAGDNQYMFFSDLPFEHALGEVYTGRRAS